MKKIGFSTLSSNLKDDLNISSVAKNGLTKKKKTSKKDDDFENYSLRFEIKLSLDSSTDCSEFSYIELLNDAEEKNNLPDDLASINERREEEEARKIAKQFENKYAPKKRRKEDFIDKGAGYDENDSFIDNDEAYDELIPSTLTTKFGGFYINTGKLEFRQCSDNEEDEVISEDDESRDFRLPNNKRKNRSSSSNNLSNNKRRKKVIESDDSKSNDNSRDLDDEEEDESESDEESCDSSESNSENNQQTSSKVTQKKKSTKHINSDQQINSIINSVIKSVNNDSELSKDDSHRIPDDLPINLKQKLNELKEMKLDQQDKKQRSFSDDINKILLSIDSILQSNGGSKNKVISWLTSYFQVTKDTLYKRIKSFKRLTEETKLKNNVQKLRVEISYLIEDHEEQFEFKNGQNDGCEKEFKFNDSIKDLLKKILNSKRILVELDNIKGKQEEDNITNYFSNEIRNIWPADWITNQTLLKAAGFISKYNQSSDVNKSSVSVINSKKNQQHLESQHNQPLNLNISKTNQQSSSLQSTNTNNNSSSTNSSHNKVKQSITQQQQQKPKDLSIDKLMNNSKIDTNISLIKTEPQIKSNSGHHLINVKHNLDNQPIQTSSVQSFINQQIKMNYRKELAAESYKQQQHSIDKLARLDPETSIMMKKMISDQKQQTKRLAQQMNQSNFTNQQTKPVSSQPTRNSSSPFDKAQNLTNLVAAHNSSPSNPINRHFSSTPNHNANSSLSAKKLIEQKLQQQLFHQTTPINKSIGTTTTKQQMTINKSPLEVDYKFEKAIQKSLIEDSAKQMNQFSRSNSTMANSNMNVLQSQKQQQQQQQQITPKPAHSSSPSTHNSPNLGLYNNQLIQQLAIHQFMNQFTNNSDAMKLLQQQGNYSMTAGHERKSSTNDLNTSNSSLNSSYNFGNNYTGNNNQTTLTSNSNQLQKQTKQQISSSQTFVPNNNLVSNNNNLITNSNLVSNLVNSGSTNPNFKSNHLAEMKNEFDVNSMISNRFTSSNQLNQSNLGQINYQNSDMISHSSLGNNSAIFTDFNRSDYLTNQQQPQHLYQCSTSIQQRLDDSKRK